MIKIYLNDVRVADKHLKLKKKFRLSDDHCNGCHNLLEKDTRVNPMIWVIFKNNSKYRVLSNLCLQYVQKIIRREDISLEKEGEIDVNKYLNYYD